MQAIQDTNASFKREVLRLSRHAYGKGKLLTGRQMCYVLYRQLKVNEDLGTYFSVQDLISVDWVGDSPQQVAKFRDQWLKVVDNLSPGVQFQDSMLRDILFSKMEKTGNTVIQNDLAHFRREARDHTYIFLLESMDRYLSHWTMEQNRAVQESEHLRTIKTYSAKGGKGDKPPQYDEPRKGKVGKKGKGKNRSDSPPPEGRGSSPPRWDRKMHC